MIPQAVHQLFSSAEELGRAGWSFELSMTMVEIYNESVMDLLGEEAKPAKHEIRSKDGRTVVTGVKVMPTCFE